MNQCKKCGKCCQILYVNLKSAPNQKHRKWLRDHYIDVIADGKKLIVPVKCKYQNKIGLCMIYDRRPEICKKFLCADLK